MRRTCHSCDRVLRKGAARRAWVLSSDGSVANGLVCIRCAIRAIAFVVPPPTTLAPLCSTCKKENATCCAECVGAMQRNVQELTKANALLVEELRRRKP